MMPALALVPSDSINHLDHIAPLCTFLDIPLIADPYFLKEPLEKYYPQVKPIYIDQHVELLDYLANHTNLIFVTSASYKIELAPMFELIYGKKIYFWYCPHGNSDKSVESFKYQDFAFTYGEEMEKRLKEEDITNHLLATIRTGNYRLSFYKEYESFYDQLVEEEVFSRFAKKQQTILYAPTWEDFEDSSSFETFGLSLINSLPHHYNLIVKFHPWTYRKHEKTLFVLEEKYRHQSNIIFLKNYPLIFPLLKQVDIYLGDYSSIGYDFLHYNRPMFFFSSSSDKKQKAYASHLHQCGMIISKKEEIFPFIEKNLLNDMYKEKRQKIFQQTFGEIVSPETIKQGVLQVIYEN